MDRSRYAASLIGVLTLASACHRDEGYDHPLKPVRVQPASSTGPGSTVRYSGRVAAVTEVNLAFRVGGYVTAVTSMRQPDGTTRLVQAGDVVRRSTVLAVIRRSDYATRFEELSGMRTGLKASVAKAKLDLERAEGLLKERTIAQAEYDSAKARYDSLVGEEIAAGARVGQAGIALSDTDLRSPIDGLVIHRGVEVGDLVAPGTPAFVVADISKVKVVFGVPDTVQKEIKIGSGVAVHTEAIAGQTFHGTVSKIAEKADERSRVFDIEATFDNPDRALKIGFIVTAELDDVSSLPSKVAVPLSAIVQVPQKRDTFAVFVVTEQNARSTASLRPVVLGDLVRNDVTITEGIAPGESVIVSGANQVRDGLQVSVIP